MSDATLDRRARKKLATREAIREAGLRLFLENGYAATSVRNITDAADLALRTFYQHFEMKEDLLLVEVREFLADAEATLEKCPNDLSPMDCHFRVNDELKPRWSAPSSAVPTTYRRMYELGMKEPDVAARYHLVVDQHVERVMAMLARRLGVDPTDMDVQLLARLSGVAYSASLAVTATSDDPVDFFEVREQILLKLGAGLDPAAVERRHKHASNTAG